MKISLLALLFSIALFYNYSCTKDDPVKYHNSSLKPMILGSWVFSGNDSSLTVYVRASTISPNTFGYTFREDDSIIARSNAGWCMTAPSFADYTGCWHFVEDSVVLVNVPYYGGNESYKIRICEINSNELKIAIIESKLD